MSDDSKDDSVHIVIVGDGDEQPQGQLDPETGALILEQPDGSVVVQFDPPGATADDGGDFYANLAEKLAPTEAQRIVEELLQAIDADDKSREEWLKTRALGIEMLGFRLEEPRTDAGTTSAPLEGMSVVRHTLLPEACIRFQANASAELLPSDGPVKVRNDAPPRPADADDTADSPGIGHNGGPSLDEDDDDGLGSAFALIEKMQGGSAQPGGQPAQPVIPDDNLAEALERDFNHYLTAIDKPYRSDTVRMLFDVGFGGCGFKKVYHCPIKRRPISRSVDAKDLIVSNDICDLEDAGRITHRIRMRKSLVKRMQLAGAYCDIDLGQPSIELNEADRTFSEVQGFDPMPQRPEDFPYVIDECYCELDLVGFEHKENGKATGLPLPYKVSIERTSRKLLELRRNWKEDDDTYQPRRVFVKYDFVRAMGFYSIGLLHILGNANRALTAAWREMLDAGMFASFPGFLYRKTMARQATNEFRVPPGGGVAIDTGGDPIQSAIMPVPYKDVGAGLLGLVQHIEEQAQRIGGTAEVMVGEGHMEAPVGTTLALIEQATKVLAAVHVGLHASQSEEFQILKERFQEDPEAFWRFNRRPTKRWEKKMFIAALDNNDLVPAADPNTSSHMHRIMKAVAIKQLQAANPTLYDPKAVDMRILNMIKFTDPQELFAPPMAMPPPSVPTDPNKMAELQQKAQQHAVESQQKTEQQALAHQGRMQELAMKSQQADREHAARMAETQADAQAREAERQTQAQMAASESADRQADRAAQQRQAEIKIDADQQKTAAQLQHEQQKHSSEMELQHVQHQQTLQQGQQQHESQLEHDQQQTAKDHQHDMQQTMAEQQHEAQQTATAQEHEVKQTEAAQSHESQSQKAELKVKSQQNAARAKKTPKKNGKS